MEELVESAKKCERLVWEQAYRVWLMLPNHTKCWISPEDLWADGMGYLVLKVIPSWNKDRGELTTIVQHSIYRYFLDGYTRFFWAKKRSEKTTSSLDNRIEELRERWGIQSPAEELGDVKDHREEMLRKCFTVEAISTIFREATTVLKGEMEKWFPTMDRRTYQTKQFLQARKEFKSRAEHWGVGPEDFRYVFRNPASLRVLEKRCRTSL